MALGLKRLVWSDGRSRPDDFNIMHDGTVVGRMYRMNSVGHELWRWTQIGWGSSHDPNGGVADTLEAAKAAFRRMGSLPSAKPRSVHFE
jgi:hypothetical protein